MLLAEQVRFARRHWGSAAASPGNVPFDSHPLFIITTTDPRKGGLLLLAEQVRFELTDGFRPSHDFQSCPL